MITPQKWRQLRARMVMLNIEESDLQEKFITGSGKGGQKINKTASCVMLQHLPSKIIIKCQQHRSRVANRYYARKRLCDKIDEILLQEKSVRQQTIAKIRQQKRRRSRRAKQKILDNKKAKSGLKASRRPPRDDS